MPLVRILRDEVVSLLQPIANMPKNPKTSKELRSYICHLSEKLTTQTLDGRAPPDNQSRFFRLSALLSHFFSASPHVRQCVRCSAPANPTPPTRTPRVHKSQEPRAKSQEPRAKSQEPRANNQEPDRCPHRCRFGFVFVAAIPQQDCVRESKNCVLLNLHPRAQEAMKEGLTSALALDSASQCEHAAIKPCVCKCKA